MGLPFSSLVVKYRPAWLSATDSQRIAICSRLGLRYTSIEDDHLLQKVAEKQQGEYDRIRLAAITTPDELPKNDKKKVKKSVIMS